MNAGAQATSQPGPQAIGINITLTVVMHIPTESKSQAKTGRHPEAAPERSLQAVEL
jgi:hypothetical protein